jgi:hypothetical protein
MADAGSETLANGVDKTIYDSTMGCTSFRVACISTSAVAAKIQVEGMHDGAYMFIEPGTEVIFRKGHGAIKTVIGQGNGGRANIYYGVVAQTALGRWKRPGL